MDLRHAGIHGAKWFLAPLGDAQPGDRAAPTSSSVTFHSLCSASAITKLHFPPMDRAFEKVSGA